MGAVIPFKVSGEYKDKLIEAAGTDKPLIAVISKMSEAQAKTAYENTQGTLLGMVDKMQAYDAEFAKFIQGIVERDDNMLILTSAINYVVDFCNQVPKDVPHADTLDNAHKKIFKKEVSRIIEKAVRSVADGKA